MSEDSPDDHAHAVVHPARLVQLAHAPIHNRITGLTLAPGLKQSVTFFSRYPWGRCGDIPKRSVHDARKGRQNLLENSRQTNSSIHVTTSARETCPPFASEASVA